MQMEKIFNRDAYVFNGRFNSGYMGAVLDIMKCSQHLYKREDVVEVYRFLADMIENGDFAWGGTFDLKKMGKSSIITPKEPKEKSIASDGSDTTPKTSGRRSAKPVVG